MMNLEKIFYVILSTILITVFILFTFIFSTADYGTGSSAKYKTIYYVDHISSAHQKVIDLFNERYKGSIRVETINLSFEKFSTNERKELLARYLRSKNNRIDIFSVDQIWVPRFAKWGIPLQNLLDSADISSVIPYAYQTCVYDDSLVAIPLYIDIALMFYRDDLLKSLPDYASLISKLDKSITWEEFINLSDRLENKYNPFYLFQADDYEGLLCSFTELMANQNNPIIDKDGNILLNTPEGKKSLNLLIDLIHNYHVSPTRVAYLKENESYRYFAENNGIFLRGWPSMIDDDNEYLSDEVRSQIKMAPLPHFNGTTPGSVFGGWNLMISKFSEKIPEVLKFTKFLLSKESQQIMFEEGGYLPINKELYRDSSFLEKHPELKFFNELYKNGVNRPFLPEYTNISDILSHYLNLAIKKEISAEHALVEAEKKINEKVILVK